MSKTHTIVEINGIKMEVDLRTAKRVEEFRVGSKVKVLRKEYNDYKVYAGVIVGFEPFEELPTVIVAYIDINYNSADLKFVHFNANSKREEFDIVASIDDEMPVKKSDVMRHFDREQAKIDQQAQELQFKRDYFLRHFNQYFPGEKV